MKPFRTIAVVVLTMITTPELCNAQMADHQKRYANQNAFYILQRAIASMKDQEKIDDYEYEPNKKPYAFLPQQNSKSYALMSKAISDPIAAQEKLLNENAHVLTLARRSFSHPYSCPPINLYTTSLRYNQDYRNIAKLFTWRAQSLARKGDYSGAVDRCLDAIRLGTLVAHGNGQLGYFQALRCISDGRETARFYIGHLTTNQAESTLSQLEKIDRGLPTYSSVSLVEKNNTLLTLRQLFAKPGWGERMTSYIYPHNKTSKLYGKMLEMQTDKHKQDAALNNISGYMDAEAAIVKQPYFTAKSMREPQFPADPILAASGHFGDIDQLSFVQMYRADCVSQTSESMFHIQLALQAYYTSKKHYPPYLQSLVPKYLRRLPLDTFDSAGKYRYRVTGQTYLLYSVGPDGTDNGGRSVPDMFTTKSGYIGDIVAKH